MENDFQARLDEHKKRQAGQPDQENELDFTPEPEPEIAAEETMEPETSAPPDMVNMTEHQKLQKSYKEARKKMNEATAQAAKERRRADALQAELDAMKSNAAPPVEQADGQAEPDLDFMPESEPQGADTPDDFASLIADIPELAPLIDRLKAIEDKVGGVESGLNEYKTQQRSEKFMERVRAAHPEIDEYVPAIDAEEYTPKQQQFADWYNSQPEDVQAMLKQDATADEAIAALSMFFSSMGEEESEGEMEPEEAMGEEPGETVEEPESTEEEESEMQEEKPEVAVVIAAKKPVPSKEKIDAARGMSAVNVKTSGSTDKGPKTFTRAQIDKMSPEDFRKNRDDIMAAMQRGEIM